MRRAALKDLSHPLPGLLVVLLVFWMVLAWSVPYGPIDDFQWGMEDGLRWWREGLLNGRYAGNMVSVAMCRFPLVKTLVMGLSMFLLPTLSALLAVREGKRYFLTALLLCHGGIMLMPPLMWQEVYGWVSGFSIYGVSTLLFLLWLLALRRVEEDRTRPWSWAVPLFLMTLFLGMFVENLTLLLLGASLLLTIYALKSPDLRPPFGACLLGASLAMIPMFFNSVLAGLLSQGAALGGLRTLSFQLEDGLTAAICQIFQRYGGEVLPAAFQYETQIPLLLALILVCTLWTGPARPLAVLAVLPLVCGLYMAGRKEAGVLGALLCLVSWLLPLPVLAVQREKGRVRWGRLFIFLAGPVSLLPLAATNTLARRLFLFPVVMLLITAADVAAPLLRGRGAAGLLAAALAALMILWGSRGIDALSCTVLRDKLTREAVETGQAVLTLPSDRHQMVSWHFRNPTSADSAFYYRQFFHIPQEITLIFLPPGSFEHWPNVPPALWEKRTEFLPNQDFEPSLP